MLLFLPHVTAEAAFSTVLRGRVTQEHDGRPVKRADISLSISDNKYSTTTDSKGFYEIADVALPSIILNVARLEVLFSGKQIYKKKIFIFTIPRNKVNAKIIGDMDIPSDPRLEYTYNHTNNRFETIKGTKAPYSAIYVNGKKITDHTESKDWEGDLDLKKGLNALIVKAKNIWGGESKPGVLYMAYFPVKHGTVTFFDGPSNVREDRSSGNPVLTWDITGNGNGADRGYNVYRAKTSGDVYDKITKKSIKTNTYTDTEIDPESEYYYTLTVLDSGIESGFSQEVSSTVNSKGGKDIPDRITKDTILTEANGPYLISSMVTIDQNAVLKIEPGVEVRFKKGKTSISGKIIARGTKEEPVIFTSDQMEPASGDWLGMVLSDGSLLDNCRVSYAGRDDHDAVRMSGRSVLASSEISDNSYNGVGIDPTNTGARIIGNLISKNGNNGISLTSSLRGGQPVVSPSTSLGINEVEPGPTKQSQTKSYVDIMDNKITDNGSYGIVTGADTNLINNTMSGNEHSDDIKIEGDQITRNVIWDKAEYEISSINVSEGSQLTIQPGSVVKATDGAVISGKIIAEGSDDEKIIFTSSSDSSFSSGVIVNASFGAWEGLSLDKGSKLENCRIKYASLGTRGIALKDEEVDIVKVESFFIDENVGLFNLEKFTAKATGQKKKNKDWLKKLTIDVLFFTAIVTPILILIVLMAFFKNKK